MKIVKVSSIEKAIAFKSMRDLFLTFVLFIIFIILERVTSVVND